VKLNHQELAKQARPSVYVTRKEEWNTTGTAVLVARTTYPLVMTNIAIENGDL